MKLFSISLFHTNLSLPKVSFIPKHQFSVISASVSSSISVASSFLSCSIMSSISSFLLQKDQNWYQEAWLGLIQNYEGSTTSPNFWSFFIKHFDLRFRCPAGVINIEVVSMLHKTFNQKTLSWLLDVIFAATSFNPPGAIFKQAVKNDKKLHELNIKQYQNEIIFR